MVILAVDHGNVYWRVAQGSRRLQATETGADDYDTRHYCGKVILSSFNTLWCALCSSSVVYILYFSHGSTLTKVCYILLLVIAYIKMRKSTTLSYHALVKIGSAPVPAITVINQPVPKTQSLRG